ncbi:MAG: hypothetical protein PWP23_2248 [Candidatus Sumerlaeota bacterium]|nr:hypothetical protein [Candidatus Sumerlaeota bacterium]
MGKERLNDQKLLGWLQGGGHVTAAQAARIEEALDQGLRLSEAIGRVPLVDAATMQAARVALGLSGAGEAEAPTPPLPSSQLRASNAAIAIKGLQRDADGVAVLDFADSGEEFPDPVRPDGEPVSGVEPPRRPVKRKVAKEPPPPPGEIASPELPAMPAARATSPADGLPTHDLTQDEGIPLVMELYGYLVGAVMGGVGALQLAYTPAAGALAEYERSGLRTSVAPLDAITADRMAARLKVMARLSPWVMDGKEAAMVLTRKKIGFEVKLKVEEAEGVRRVTLHFVSEGPMN